MILESNDMNFWIAELIFVTLQLVLFIPFYLVWRNDCKERGKDNLAVSLSERFFAWLVWCPLWFVPILCVVRGR